jgi:hypothetical protein
MTVVVQLQLCLSIRNTNLQPPARCSATSSSCSAGAGAGWRLETRQALSAGIHLIYTAIAHYAALLTLV